MKLQVLGDKKEHGRLALTCLLAGAVLGNSGVIFAEVIGDTLALAGIVYGAVWLYNKVLLWKS